MRDEKKVTFQGRELTVEDIENIKSPALKEILREQLLRQSEETGERYHHDKYSRFPYCGILPND